MRQWLTGTLFFIWNIVPCKIIFSQVPPDYKLISVADGLSYRDVKFTTRDPRGFLWIMNSGIDFYDGQSFTSYNQFDPDHFIPVSNIRTGCKLADSLLIFTEAKSLFSLNMLNGHVKPMPFPEGMDTTFNDFVSIQDRQYYPNLLFVTRSDAGSSIQVVDRNWHFLFKHDVPKLTGNLAKIVRSSINGPDGVIWVLDPANLAIQRIDGNNQVNGNPTVERFAFKYPTSDPDINYRFVYLKDFGLVICRNDGLILAIRDGEHEVTEVMNLPVDNETFNPSHVDSHGLIWSITESQLIQLNVRTKEYKLYNLRLFGSYNATLRNSYEDNEGITWISSEVGLLQILPDPKPFHAACVQTETNRNFQLREILPADSSSVYCRVFDTQTDLVELQFNAGIPMDTITRLQKVPRGGVFQRHGEYLYTVLSGDTTLIQIHLPDFNKTEITLPVRATTQYYNQFLIDDSGMLWYQDIQNQLTGFNLETHESKNIRLEVTNLRSPWRVFQLRGDYIFIGTETTGFMVYDRESGKLISEFNTNTAHPLSGNFINALIIESDTILWLGTLGAGINRINLSTGNVQHYTTADGLANNFVASMIQDDDGDLWIGTYKGLSKFINTENRFYNYYTTDGLSDDEFNYGSAYRSPEGTILVGSLNGITLFNPKDIIGNVPLPSVQLTRIQKYNSRDDKLTTMDQVTDLGGVVEISPYDNFFDFSFAVPSFLRNASFEFFSRLKGVEKDWQWHGRNSSIRYQKLPAGQYELELMATDANGNKTIEPTIIKIVVKQIFYKSVWFLILMMVSTLALVVAIYRYRVRLLQKELETRTRIASDLHDEVGGSLTGLYLQMQMMEMKASEQEKSSLSKANNIINESITKMRDLVWSIDARSDSWGKTIERMEDFASDVLSPRDIQIHFHHQMDLNSPIDARTKHNLYLIYKEALNNIAKHSNATKVDIHIIAEKDKLFFTIQDDGTPSARKSFSGQGLQNMQMRAERLGGKIITQQNEQGFVVKLEAPIKI